MNALIPFTADELADMVWLKTGRNPSSIRCQALLVVAEFEDGSMAIHRIEDLIVGSAMSLRWSPSQYLDAERRLDS